MSVSGGDSGQDVELYLAPIIDCFTVLTIYLLITASFINLTALDVGVSATGTAAPSEPSSEPPPMILTMQLAEGNRLIMNVSGGTLVSDIVVQIEPGTTGGWNLNELSTRLKQIQERWPQVQELSVSADPTINYKDIVNIINESQRVLTKVFISG